jgi:hypothetical protein
VSPSGPQMRTRSCSATSPTSTWPRGSETAVRSPTRCSSRISRPSRSSTPCKARAGRSGGPRPGHPRRCVPGRVRHVPPPRPGRAAGDRPPRAPLRRPAADEAPGGRAQSQRRDRRGGAPVHAPPRRRRRRGLAHRQRIVEVLSSDWGFYTTATDNLDKIPRLVAEINPELGRDVAAAAAEIRDEVERAPKSRSFKLRARVGRRKRWYELPDESIT